MKIEAWHQNVMLVTEHADLRAAVAKAFDGETDLHVVSDGVKAIADLEKREFNVIIIDASTTDIKVNQYEEKQVVPFLEITQFAQQMYPGITIIVLVNKLHSGSGSFAAKSGAALIMDRKAISIDRMVYMIRVMRRRSFRTVLIRDLPLHAEFPIMLYHYLPFNEKFIPFLLPHLPYTEEKRAKLTEQKIRHLYVKDKEFDHFIEWLKKNSKSESLFTEELAHCRRQFRLLISEVFDTATDGQIHAGIKIFETGMEIVDQLGKLVSKYPDPYTCLNELPYPRWSALAHGLNCVMYTFIFEKLCKLASVREVAFAALIHNLGLSDIPQPILKKKEMDMTAAEMADYKKHIQYIDEILKRKMIPVGPIIERAVHSHHEHFDGSGFPDSLAGVNLPKEAAFLAIAGSFDYFHTVRPGEEFKTTEEAWEALMQYHTSTTLFHKKFNPTLLDEMKQIFKQ